MKKLKKILCVILASVLLVPCGVTAVSAESADAECSFGGGVSLMGETIKAFFEGIIAKFKLLFDKIALFFTGDKFTGSDYTIPELDLRQRAFEKREYSHRLPCRSR